MECRELTDRALNRLLGEADAAELADFERHLAGCPRCTAALAAIEETWGALGADPDASVTPEFRSRTLALLHDEMDRRAIACFDQALDDVGIPDGARLRQVLHDYFAWATTTTMAQYHESADDVPAGLTIPRWSWDGLVV